MAQQVYSVTAAEVHALRLAFAPTVDTPTLEDLIAQAAAEINGALRKWFPPSSITEEIYPDDWQALRAGVMDGAGAQYGYTVSGNYTGVAEMRQRYIALIKRINEEPRSFACIDSTANTVDRVQSASSGLTERQISLARDASNVPLRSQSPFTWGM